MRGDRKPICGYRGLGEGRIGSDCLIGSGFSFGLVEMFGTRSRWWLHNVVNVLNYALEWLVVCYMYFTLIKKKKDEERTASDTFCTSLFGGKEND